MKRITLLLLSVFFAPFIIFAEDAAPKPRALLFTRSAGWVHDVVKEPGGKPSVVEVAVRGLAAKNGWDLVATKDGSLFNAAYLKQFKAVIFYTSGDLMTSGGDGAPAMSAEGKQALLNFVAHGGGFVGVHCAVDTFNTDSSRKRLPPGTIDPYTLMIGGEFVTHGAVQTATVTLPDATFPTCDCPDHKATFHDEWYVIKNRNPDSHALMILGTPDMAQTLYTNLPPYPVSWIRKQGQGRVFYTALGHTPEIWANERFLDFLAAGIRFATGEISADTLENNDAVMKLAEQISAESAAKKAAAAKKSSPAAK